MIVVITAENFRRVRNKDVKLFCVLLVGRKIDDDPVPLQDLLETASVSMAEQKCAFGIDVGCTGVWVLVVDRPHTLESESGYDHDDSDLVFLNNVVHFAGQS